MSLLMPFVIEFVTIAILCGLFWLLVMRVMDKEKARRKSPFTKDLLKAPGESSSRKLEELSDDFWRRYMTLSVCFGFVVGIALGVFIPQFKNPIFSTLFAIAGLAYVSHEMVKIRQNIRERRNYRLGLDGERHTAQALQPLLAEGYELFHDLEFKDATGKPFNIDHVLLGPAGVIAIETKAKSKDPEGKGKEAAHARYDGKRISFPDGYETAWLDQALANAKHLSRELSAHTGEKVFVHAAISIPGWYVTKTCKEEGNPAVQNPEMVRSWVLELPAVSLQTAQRNRIRGFLTRSNARPTD